MSCPSIDTAQALLSQSLNSNTLLKMAQSVPVVGGLIQNETDLNAVLDGQLGQLTAYTNFKNRIFAITGLFASQQLFFKNFHSVVPFGNGAPNLIQLAGVASSVYCNQDDLEKDLKDFVDPSDVVDGFSNITSGITSVYSRLSSASVVPGTPIYPLTPDQPGGFYSTDIASINSDIDGFLGQVESSQLAISAKMSGISAKTNEIYQMQTALASVSNIKSIVNGKAKNLIANMIPPAVSTIAGIV